MSDLGKCMFQDPAGCALHALTLCEGSGGAAEAAYQLVAGAAARGALAPQQLFALARYLQHRAHPARAYRLALLAMRNLHLSYNQVCVVCVIYICFNQSFSHCNSSPFHFRILILR